MNEDVPLIVISKLTNYYNKYDDNDGDDEGVCDRFTKITSTVKHILPSIKKFKKVNFNYIN